MDNKINYQNSLCEINYILENLDESLLTKIPSYFIDWVKENMNPEYTINLTTDTPLHKQDLLPETRGFVAVIFNKFLSTEEEKKEILRKEAETYISKHQEKYEQFDIDLKARKEKINSKKIETHHIDLTPTVITKKENIFKHFLNSIINIFKK